MPLPHRTQKRTPGNPSKTLARLKKPLNSSRRSRLRNFVKEIMTIGQLFCRSSRAMLPLRLRVRTTKELMPRYVLLLLMFNWIQLIPITRRLRGDRPKSLRTKPPEWRWILHYSTNTISCTHLDIVHSSQYV